MQLTNIQKARARRIQTWGFHYPQTIVYVADKWDLPLSYALASLTLESGKGKNIFGHDPTVSIPDRWKGKKVTYLRYVYYKHRRIRLGLQGVGPMQLTSLGFQIKADQRGGCHKAIHSMSVGFELMKKLTDSYGKWDGARRFNGSGQAARLYADKWVDLQRYYHNLLSN